MSIDFESPAARVIKQFDKDSEEQFRIPTDLPDITFLRRLSIQGRLRYNTATNATVTITPTIGETQFFYKIYLTATTAASTFAILNDAMTRASMRLDTSSSIMLDFFDSLVGNSSKAFTVTSSGAGSVISVLSWIENTSRIRDVTI